MLASVSRRYPEPKGRFPRVTHPCATRAEALVRLACVRHAASVRSEPGSNSQVQAGQRSEDRIHLTGPLNATSPKLSKLFVSYCLTEMLKRPAMPVPSGTGPRPTVKTAACASLLTTRYQRYPRSRGPQENRNTPRPTPSRSGPPGPDCLLCSRPVGASLAATASGGALYAGSPGGGKHFFRPTAIFLAAYPRRT